MQQGSQFLKRIVPGHFVAQHNIQRTSVARLKRTEWKGRMPVVNRERWLCATMLELADVDPVTFSEAEYSHELAGRLAELLDPAEVMVLLVDKGGHLCLAAASTERARWLAGVEVLAAEGPCTLGYRASRAALNRGNAALAVQWPRFAVAVRASCPPA